MNALIAATSFDSFSGEIVNNESFIKILGLILSYYFPIGKYCQCHI
jgi:hypothetical protein